MFQEVSFVTLLMLHSAVQSLSVQASCRENVSLKCQEVGSEFGSEFISVTWYKLIHQNKCGILRWGSKDKKKPQFFIKFNRTVHSDQNYSLLISAVTPADSGTYQCEVGAMIGGQNKRNEVKLDVSECVTPAVWATPTPVPNATSDLSSTQVHELPVLWSAVIYGIACIAKIALSIISVLIIRCVQSKSSKRRQQKW
ncbi:hypothetical protein PBY51_001193 [Eleginops maclovinus]|uniref:Ig-like domain-containing protein n=1 Tax=Eleginops maclovinus TaxID=56733 RepID=A0AAN7XP00_ELEMC|nr:hypothetical protein PBY51_001193 [Eleginops maclovinus]